MKREISCEWLAIRPLHGPVFYKLCKQLGLSLAVQPYKHSMCYVPVRGPVFQVR